MQCAHNARSRRAHGLSKTEVRYWHRMSRIHLHSPGPRTRCVAAARRARQTIRFSAPRARQGCQAAARLA